MDDTPLSTARKWKLIFKVLALNALVVPILLLISQEFISQERVGHLVHSYPEFYYESFRIFGSFLKKYVFETAILEESYARGLLWLLIVSKMKVVMFKKHDLTSLVLWASLIIPTFQWATLHPIFLPVFFAGLTWGWLVIKTKSMWPAVVSHMLANLSIYFLIKLVQLLGYGYLLYKY